MEKGRQLEYRHTIQFFKSSNRANLKVASDRFRHIDLFVLLTSFINVLLPDTYERIIQFLSVIEDNSSKNERLDFFLIGCLSECLLYDKNSTLKKEIAKVVKPATTLRKLMKRK